MTTTTYSYNALTKSHDFYFYVRMTHICETKDPVSDTLTVQVS